MNEITGKLVTLGTDLKTGNTLYTFSSHSKPSEDAQKLLDEECTIKFGKARKGRSNNSNAYMWTLLQQIAEKIDSDRWSVYLEMLKKYSRSFTFVIVKESAVERMKSQWRECIDLGEVNVNGQEGHQLQLFFGSSTFDTKEMAVLLNGVVQEAKELGITTLDDLEIERLVKEWNNG